MSLLGAHVSTQGGVAEAPARFRAELVRHGIRAVVAHDSYLINLASPDDGLRRDSSATREGTPSAWRPCRGRWAC